MRFFPLAAVGCLLLATASAEVLFEDRFDDKWDQRWHKSSWKQSEGSAGGFSLTAGKWFGGDEAAAQGIQTGPDSKYHATWTEMKRPYTNKNKELVLQFQVKHEQDLDCGGGYIKLLPASSKSKMKDFGGETPYSVMFGPDICGYSTRKTHVILPYGGKNHLVKKDIKCETDQLSHVYTLRIMPNNTYEVYIDLKKVESGSLYDDFDMLPPKMIKDPKAVKPADWDEREKIEDPADKKPAGWDDIPATIVDPDAKKPDDWSDEDDGDWEPPTISNPDYKGEWKAKMVDNPAYKGIWIAPDIDNPEYKHDDNLYLLKDLKYLGFELWQVKSGSIFDNIIVTDNVEEALTFGEETWAAVTNQEKEALDKIKEAEKKEAEAKDPADTKSAAADDDEYDTEDDDKQDVPAEKLVQPNEDEHEKDEL